MMSFNFTVRMFAAIGLTLLLWPESAVAQVPPPPASEEHVLLLIDRSGSMQTVRSDGRTRFQTAIDRAKEYVEASASLPRHFAVWSFEGTSYYRHQGFTQDVSATLSTLNSLRVGSGVTPLALAACAAVDEIKAYRPSVIARKKLRLGSDGEENSTPSNTQCAGPNSSTTYPNLTSQSWEWKVRNKLRTGNPQNASNVPWTIIFDVDAFFDYIRLNDSAAPVYEVTPKGDMLVMDKSATGGTTLPSSFLVLLNGMAADSGGKFNAVVDSAPTPVFGDTNQDNCVDTLDYNLVIANYGLAVPPAAPVADINGDGVVDYNDYSIIASNWGMGSGCSAPPMP
jgi:von Willebrand factor type A domain